LSADIAVVVIVLSGKSHDKWSWWPCNVFYIQE